MAGWTLDTLGGDDLNTTQFKSTLMRNAVRMQTGARNVTAAERGALFPAFAGSTLASRTIQVQHEIKGSGTTHEDNLDALKKLYDPRHGERTLVYTDRGVSKRATVVATQLVPHGSGTGQEFVIGQWVLLEQRFYADSADSVAAASKSSSPATVSVTNDGPTESPEITYTLSPTAQKAATDGQLYGWYVTPIYRSPRPASSWPIDLTHDASGYGWDHATEVSASRSDSTGKDVEVYCNSRRVMRWFGPSGQGDANQADTSIWVNADFPAARSWTYAGASTLGSGATTVKVEERLGAMPQTPFYAAFFDGSTTIEVVRVTDYDEDTRELTVVRGQRGTSATTWSSGSTMWWCPVLYTVVYGYTSVGVPEYIDDDYKPIVLENTGARSTNSTHRYTHFQETRDAADTQDRKPRGGSWRTRSMADIEREAKDGDGDMYMRYVPRTASLSTDAATGSLMAIAYRSGGPTAGHPIVDRWELQSPIGISSYDYDYDATTISFASSNYEAQLEVLCVDIDGNVELIDDHDSTEGTGSGTGITATPASLAYVLWFKLDAFDPKIDYTQVSLTANEPTDADGFTVDNVIVTYDSDERVVCAWASARHNVYQFGRPDAPATLENDDGDTLSLNGVVVQLSDTIDIIVSSRQTTIDDGTSVAHLLTGDYPWLLPGTNDVTYTETGIGTVDIGISSYRSAWS